MKYILPLITVILVACSGGETEDVSDQDVIEHNVREYLFLNDSLEVSSSITDTIFVSDLEEMLNTLEKNLMLIQQDIDTMQLIIDHLAYANMQDESPSIEMDPKQEVKLLKHQLKLQQLETKKTSFKQSNRVLLHLRRSQLNSISGYKISAQYLHKNKPVTISLLMDADFCVID
ncbi:MAG: hypothetical protein WDZ35_16125 [Crocinitomicaceae bacterium]